MLENPDDEGNYLFKKKYLVSASSVSLVEPKNKK